MKSYAFNKVNFCAGLALIALLVMLAAGLKLNTASASRLQEQGCRVAPAQPKTQPPEPITVEAEPSVQLDQLLKIPGQFANPILDTKLIRFDVSENAKRFIFDETPLHADGAPAYGNEFVTEGHIYSFGTLNGANGVNADGSPEFPDKVIGRWVCRGWHVGEGAKTQTGPCVVTHQLYDLGNKPGQALLTTDGFELVDLNEPILRAISGGTGPFAQARGEARQVMIGFNQLNGVNLRFELRVMNR